MGAEFEFVKAPIIPGYIVKKFDCDVCENGKSRIVVVYEEFNQESDTDEPIIVEAKP